MSKIGERGCRIFTQINCHRIIKINVGNFMNNLENNEIGNEGVRHLSKA